MNTPRTRKALTAVLAAIACLSLAATALASDGGTAVSGMYATFWALVPPVVAIILALITKEAYSSLFIGILVGALFQCATLLVFGGVALLGGKLAIWFNKSVREQILLNRAAGCVFVALAVALAFTGR